MLKRILVGLFVVALCSGAASAQSITTNANSAFRDYVVDGVPASGVHNPSKADIRALFAQIDTAIGGGGGGGGSGAAGLTIVWHRINPVSSGTSFSIGSSLSAKQIVIVLLNGAPQPQGTAFTVSGSSATFTGAGFTTSDVIDYAIVTVS